MGFFRRKKPGRHSHGEVQGNLLIATQRIREAVRDQAPFPQLERRLEEWGVWRETLHRTSLIKWSWWSTVDSLVFAERVAASLPPGSFSKRGKL